MAFAGAFLTQIDELKIQAEGVGELIRLLRVEAVQQGVLRLPAAFTAEMAGALGELAHGVEMLENLRAGLFQYDFVQAADELFDFPFEYLAHFESEGESA